MISTTPFAPGSDPLKGVRFMDRDVLLTDATLQVRKRKHSLEHVSEVRTHHEPPRIVAPLVVAAAASGIGVPSLAWYSSAAPAALPWVTALTLLASSVALFGAILWLLTSADQYCLVLSRVGGSQTVMRSADYQWVVRVAAEIQSVLAEMRAARRSARFAGPER